SKVVLVGGEYSAARDEYVTPIGPMYGVELMGQSVESELAGDTIGGLPRWWMGVLPLVSVLLLVWLYHRFRLRQAILAAMLLVPLLALVSSYLVFSSFALWAYFAPVLLGIMIVQIYQKGAEYAKTLDRGLNVGVSEKPSRTRPSPRRSHRGR